MMILLHDLMDEDLNEHEFPLVSLSFYLHTVLRMLAQFDELLLVWAEYFSCQFTVVREKDEFI